jgi:ATP/maltotriose-dependent transcriptional regulator MalT
VNVHARSWLLSSYQLLPIPVDTAIGRAEQFLEETAPGDPWAQATILDESSLLYALAGRFADARASIARAQSLYHGLEIKLNNCALLIGEIEMAAGNPAAAEPELRKGCQALRAKQNRGILCSYLSVLAEAVYAQGRLDEAYQLTQQAEAISPVRDPDAQTKWRAVRAKVLARRGQFAAARQLVDEAAAIAAPSCSTVLQAYALEAHAEVSRLAGAPEEAADRLRQALHMYEERRASALAGRTRAALASLPADRQ